MAASLAVEHQALTKIIGAVEAFDKRLDDAVELLAIADDEILRWLEQETRILNLWMRAMNAAARKA